ncbi:TRAP transporter small permease [Roseibium sp. MMSF_3544]|uniref:TRAP transporter small permease n=1 Tax=unclassified Roseibium TaxID=2629323 RepID=UPI0027401C98|nr:TRAP transporter small permease [Roseibium sp. MMSF_3544]
MRFQHVVRVARAIHILSSLWVFVLALVILTDVFGRILFLSPLPGTKEILQNSVIMITFLQLPLAIFSGSMLRTTLVIDAMPPVVKRLLRSLCFILGAGLFAAISYATVPEALDALRLGEYEGEGSLRIYTWPIRFLIVVTAAFAAFAYVSLIIADWTGALGPSDSLTDR